MVQEVLPRMIPDNVQFKNIPPKYDTMVTGYFGLFASPGLICLDDRLLTAYQTEMVLFGTDCSI